MDDAHIHDQKAGSSSPLVQPLGLFLLVTDYEVSIWVCYPGSFYLLFSFVFLSWVILFFIYEFLIVIL